MQPAGGLRLSKVRCGNVVEWYGTLILSTVRFWTYKKRYDTSLVECLQSDLKKSSK